MPAQRPRAYAHELAISAVRYDTMLVAELANRLTARLGVAPVWAGQAEQQPADATSALADASRVALVLHQRLWQHDGATELDADVLRERVNARPESVRVVTLDNSPIPEWLAGVETRDFASMGPEGVAQFALDAIVTLGGSIKDLPPVSDAPPAGASRWPEGPPPFLAQPRSQSALRRELDAIATESEPRLQAAEERLVGLVVEQHSLPNRFVARFDDVGISFSWVAGRFGTVADGRLMVIQWSGIAGEHRGLRALKTASPVREAVYHAESSGPDNWCWRSDEPHGRACSTANLVAEWFAGASIAAHGGAAIPALP